MPNFIFNLIQIQITCGNYMQPQSRRIFLLSPFRGGTQIKELSNLVGHKTWLDCGTQAWGSTPLT